MREKLLAVSQLALIVGCDSFSSPCPEFDGSWAEYPVECLMASNDPMLADSDRAQVERLGQLIKSIQARTGWQDQEFLGMAGHVQERIAVEHHRHADYLVSLEEILEQVVLFGAVAPRELSPAVVDVIGVSRSSELHPVHQK